MSRHVCDPLAGPTWPAIASIDSAVAMVIFLLVCVAALRLRRLTGSSAR